MTAVLPTLIDLVPEFISGVCRDPEATTVKLIYDAPTARSTVIYSISWSDLAGSEEAVRSTVDKFMSKVQEPKEPEEPEEVVPLKLAQSHTNYRVGGPPAPVDAMCDGPCKRKFPSNQLNSIGRCGHYLCNACFGIVENSDGTSGCSSKSCFWRGSRENTDKCYETEVCQKQRARAREMKARGIDVTSAVSFSDSETEIDIPEVKEVRVTLALLYQDAQYGVTHNITQLTTSSETLIGRAILELLKKGKPTGQKPEDRVRRGSLYFVVKGDGKKELHRLHKKEVYGKQLRSLMKTEASMCFVLDMDSCVRKSSFCLI